MPRPAISISTGQFAAEQIAGQANSWSGKASIFDLEVTHVGEEGASVPTTTYLEEASMGLRHGLGDPRMRKRPGSADPKPLSPKGGKPNNAELVTILSECLKLEPAAATCRALFWIILGTLFQLTSETVLDGFRKDLGRQWHLFNLEVSHKLRKDTHEWIITAVPVVCGQAIYRLLCDGFQEDRKLFVAHGKKLVTKIGLVIHYELTGFQPNVELVRQARRRLFLPSLMQAPHANQENLLRGQRRQELLDQNSSEGPRPLCFGNVEAPGTEETQLEHVLQGRADRLMALMSRTPSAAKGSTVKEVPPELSVDRYEDLTMIGMDLLATHLEAISGPAHGNASEDDTDGSPYDFDQASRCSSPVSLSPPDSPKLGGKSIAFSFPFESTTILSPARGLQKAKEDCLQTTAASALSLRSDRVSTPSTMQRLRVKAKTVGRLSFLRSSSSLQREEEAKLKRQRLDALEGFITSESVPEACSSKELNTTWVSPTVKSLVPDAASRDVLAKTKADTFLVKMKTSPTMVRPLSTPALRSLQKDGNGKIKIRPADRPAERPADAATVSQVSLKDDGSTAGSSLKFVKGNLYDASLGSSTSLGSALKSGLPKLGDVTVNLDGPSNISSKVVISRLENDSKAFCAQSFSMYLKEHDVFTGTIKQRFDEKRLRDEESAYLRKMHLLVGGPPMRLNFPGGLRPIRSAGRLDIYGM